MDHNSDDSAVIKKVGVKSFGIDDILSHASASARNKQSSKENQKSSETKTVSGRSPLDALFTMTTNFESLKQKSGMVLISRYNSKCLFNKDGDNVSKLQTHGSEKSQGKIPVKG